MSLVSGSYETNIFMYIFLDQRKTNGNDSIKDAIIATKATLRFEPKNTNEMIKAAIPIATFNP